MNIISKIILVLLFLSNISFASSINGEKVFRQYCWGCHHETSVAFGPSFEQIANKRTMEEMQGYIIAPKSIYQQFGHKRSVMPSFRDKLSSEQLDAITDYIISFKSKKD
jgi:mono/diheme cytochrome c family protein